MSSSEFSDSWNKITEWLNQNAPGIYSSLQPPATASELQRIEDYYKVEPPQDLIDLLSLHNGQDASGGDIINFIFGFEFLSINSSLSMHKGAVVDYIEDIEFQNYEYIHGSIESVKETPLHFYRLLEGHVRYSVCVDFKPSKEGKFGQVVFFDTESMAAYKVSDSVAKMLSRFAADLEAGNYTVAADNPTWLNTSKEVDLSNWGYHRMYEVYPDGR